MLFAAVTEFTMNLTAANRTLQLAFAARHRSVRVYAAGFPHGAAGCAFGSAFGVHAAGAA